MVMKKEVNGDILLHSSIVEIIRVLYDDNSELRFCQVQKGTDRDSSSQQRTWCTGSKSRTSEKAFPER